MTRLLLLLLIAACSSVRDHNSMIEEMRAESQANPQARLDRVISRIREPLDLPADRGAFTLPFDLAPVPTVRGTLNGVEARFAVDTGASSITIFAPLARKAGVYVAPNVEPGVAVSPGHRRRVYVGAARKLELGPLRVRSFPVLIAAEQQMRGGFLSDPYYDGIIGGALLTQYNVEFDLKKEELRFTPHNRRGQASVIFTTVTLNDVRYRMLVDSGANGLFLEPWAARELRLIDESEAESLSASASSAADVKMGYVRIERVSIDGKEFQGVAAGVVATFGRDARPADGQRLAGLLGFTGFGKRVWTINYETLQLHLDD